MPATSSEASPVPPEPSLRAAGEVERDEKYRRFSRFYQGWVDYMNTNPIEPPRAWSPYSRELYFSGAEAAKAEIAELRDASV